MLTDDTFHAWCLRNTIAPETQAYIERIRQSQPVRKVRSRASNVSGRYPSSKMGRTIQFESHHVELYGIYEMEYDDAVSYALDLLKVKAVGIDEAQHLMQADATQKPSIQLDWLKSLTNRSNLLYILLGNFSPYDFCHLNGQIARRVREEQFCRYHLDQQDDAVEFTSALKVLLEQFPLQVNLPEMLMHWKWFGEWSIGCIGILSDWVVETASTLCRAGETVLTLEALAKHALKPAQRLKLETEARTGEFKIEEAKKESERELQRLLGKPSTVPMSALPRLPLGTSAPTAPLSLPSHASSRIERASYRGG